MAHLLPHFGGFCNIVITVLIIWAVVAIRTGDRSLHPKLMKLALVFGAVFLVTYLAQVAILGHGTAPGEGAVRSFFLIVLATHTVAAVLVLPLVLRAFYLAIKERFDDHKKIVRFAFPIWLYVGITGVIIYVMMYHLDLGTSGA